jgi:hypothetical protein
MRNITTSFRQRCQRTSLVSPNYVAFQPVSMGRAVAILRSYSDYKRRERRLGYESCDEKVLVLFNFLFEVPP